VRRPRLFDEVVTVSGKTNSRDKSIVTVSDVAAHAHVSRASVSYALTQPDRVSEKTLAKVMRAAEELGYVGNDAARQLRVGHSRAIALLVPNAANPVYAEIASGAEGAAAERNRFIFLANSNGSIVRESQYIRFFESQRVTGILVAPIEGVPEALFELEEKGIPFVLFGAQPDDPTLPLVTGDDEIGGRLAIAHLVERGRRTLAFIGGPRVTIAKRIQGAVDEAHEAGDDVSLEVIEVGSQTVRTGEKAAAELLARGADRLPDGIFAGNDLIALGLLQQLIRAGIPVPERVSIVGYDDIEFAGSAIVPLTSIRHASAAMGDAAVRLLLGGPRQSREKGADFQSSHPPQLIVRASTGGPSGDEIGRSRLDAETSL
jgi:LacI family transcriptional regulator